MNQQIRTDLALERWSMAQTNLGRSRGVEGVVHHRKSMHGIDVHSMEILSDEAADSLCKPKGSYYTISMDNPIKRQSDSFVYCAHTIADILKRLLPKRKRVLIACLGNPAITPDAIGPECAKHIMVTRHLKAHLPDTFAQFGEVSVICPGVLGTTGIESALLVKGAVEATRPDAVIAIDALAAAGPDRLCRTIQICDTGIAPGSGVGNRRYALNESTLGVPVVAAGVPTVVDAHTLAGELGKPNGTEPQTHPQLESMFVTPREIDTFVSDSAKLLGYGINFALHEGLTLEDVDLFIS